MRAAGAFERADTLAALLVFAAALTVASVVRFALWPDAKRFTSCNWFRSADCVQFAVRSWSRD
jgi:hypothetical protein